VATDVAHAQLGQGVIADREVVGATGGDDDPGHDERGEDGRDRGGCCTDARTSPPARGQADAVWMARQTRSAVQDMSMCVTPRWRTASTTAFWIAGVEPMVPDSPMPFAPRGLRGLSVCVFETSKLQSSAADGI
jgi:hypothetical protein